MIVARREEKLKNQIAFMCVCECAELGGVLMQNNNNNNNTKNILPHSWRRSSWFTFFLIIIQFFVRF